MGCIRSDSSDRRPHAIQPRAAVLAAIAGLGWGLCPSAGAQPLTTAFTYQGELTAAGTPADGAYDMRFRLFDASSGGGQVGTTLCVDNITVTGGRFTVQLDFGSQYAGQQRFLDVQVRADTGLNCSNATGYTVLTSRQSLTATPNAAYSLSAGTAANASQLNGQAAGFYTNAANLSSGTLSDSRLSPLVPRTNAANAFTANNSFASDVLVGGRVGSTTGGITLMAQGQEILRISPAGTVGSTFSPNIVGGSSANSIDTGLSVGAAILAGGNFTNANTVTGVSNHAVIAGGINNHVIGGASATIAGGSSNTAQASHAAVGGGQSNTASGSHSVVAGGNLNSAPGFNATIGGGASNTSTANLTTVGGGWLNDAVTNGATVAGGVGNTAGTDSLFGYDAFVGGGLNNSALDDHSVVVGGEGNQAVAAKSTVGGGYGNVAGGLISTVAGGNENQANGFGSMVPGGFYNVAQGESSAAWGQRAKAMHRGTHVWADATGTDFASTAINQFLIRAGGGVGINTNAPGARLNVHGATPGVNIFTGDLAPFGSAGLEMNFSSAGLGSSALMFLAVNSSPRFFVGSQGEVFTQGTIQAGGAVIVPQGSHTTFPEVLLRPFHEPVGVSSEFDGVASIVNLDNNFRLGSRDETFNRGGAVRIDARPGSQLFQFWHRAQASGAENLCAWLDHAGNFSNGGTIASIGSISTGGTVFSTGNITSGGRVAGTGTGFSSNAAAWFQNGTTAGDAMFAHASGSGNSWGVNGRSGGDIGVGVHGVASHTTGANFGVLGTTSSPAAGFGVFASGRLGASGVKSFRIDHPADPEHKYLLHYSAESPEVVNFYRGTVTLDGAGEAVVTMPDYFASINSDPSYTLTAVGAPMPMLHVISEIDPAAMEAGALAAPGDAVPECSFIISGGVPGGRVSWRVEAARNDAWVRTYGAPVEVVKQGLERGTYQHPELYGKPANRALMHKGDPAQH